MDAGVCVRVRDGRVRAPVAAGDHGLLERRPGLERELALGLLPCVVDTDVDRRIEENGPLEPLWLAGEEVRRQQAAERVAHDDGGRETEVVHGGEDVVAVLHGVPRRVPGRMAVAPQVESVQPEAR